MRTPRFLLHSKKPLKPGDLAAVEPKEFHHLKEVLRLRVGDAVEAIDPNSNCIFEATIHELSPEFAEVKIGQLIVEGESLAPVVLVLALPKSKTCSEIVEECAAIGISAIHLFTSERTQGRLSAEQRTNLLERLSRVAESALKQSGGAAAPEIAIHNSLSAALAALHGSEKQNETDRRYVFSPKASKKDLLFPTLIRPIPGDFSTSTTLEQATESAEIPVVSRIYLLIGAEGGLSDQELQIAQQFRYQVASLGSRTLRTETAAAIACGIAALCSR